MRPLVLGDIVFVLERQADVVEAVEQAMAAELFDIERNRQAKVVGERFLFEIGRELVAGMSGSTLEQVVDLGVAEHDRQHAVLEAVVIENVGEAGGDDHAEAVILQRPRGVLAAGAAAEIAASQQDARALGGGLVKFEVGVERAIVVADPVPEQKFAEARPLDPLEELLGDDLIGVDVGAIEGDNFAGEGGEGFYEFS